MQIAVVENPRKRRRRTYTAKQRAAGFGGRKRRTSRRPRPRRRRRNPALATYTALNPRRRRRYRAAPTKRRYRRRRNPNMLGGFTRMLNWTTGFGVATGMIVSGTAPGMINRFWAGMPRGEYLDKAWRVGLTVGAAMVVRQTFRANQFAMGMVAGAIGWELYELLNQYVLPAVGLSGLSAGDYVTTSELNEIGMSGYVAQGDRLTGYEVTDEALAA